jgi:hypothetical protein
MELIANALQTVEAGANVQFTDEAISGCNSILHRAGSGQVTLRGITNQCRARFKAFFSGNIAIPTGGIVEAISIAISVNGEAIASTTMIQTPAAVEEFANVASAVYLDVPAGCCITVSVKNTSEQAIEIQNANLIIERVA